MITNNGTIDPNSRLAAGDIEDLVGDADLTEQQIDDINAAIEAWADADPDGYSEHAARQLTSDIRRILA